jgi:hypothetical protein
MAGVMEQLRLIVDHGDPAIRTAFMGALTAILRDAGINATLKGFEQTQRAADKGVLNYKDLTAATGQLIAEGHLELIVTEQIDVPQVMVQDLTDAALAELARKGKLGNLQVEGKAMLDELGLDLEHMRALLDEAQDEIQEQHPEAKKISASLAADICNAAKNKIHKYIQAKLPTCPVAVEALSRPLPDGTGFEFALAVSVDPDKLREFKRGRKEED